MLQKSTCIYNNSKLFCFVCLFKNIFQTFIYLRDFIKGLGLFVFKSEISHEEPNLQNVVIWFHWSLVLIMSSHDAALVKVQQLKSVWHPSYTLRVRVYLTHVCPLSTSWTEDPSAYSAEGKCTTNVSWLKICYGKSVWYVCVAMSFTFWAEE